LKTVVFTIDLDAPKAQGNAYLSNKRKRLTFENNQLLQVQLLNGNPFKYDYVLNYKTINLFSDTPPSFLKPEAGAGNQLDDSESLVIPEKVLSESEILKDQEELLDSIQEFGSNLEEYQDVLMSLESIDHDIHNDFRDKAKEWFTALYNSKQHLILNIEQLATPSAEIIANSDEITRAFEALKPLYEKIMRQVNESYLLPIDVFGDNIDYVEIKLERYINTTKVDEYNYKLWLTGGVKIDFSAGAFITSLINKSYSATAVTNSTTGATAYNIIEDNTGNYNLGFGPMANITFRTGGWFKPVLNVGTLLTSETDFQILVGGGLIIGKLERFIFHTGLTMGTVAELKNTYSTGTDTSYTLNDPNEVPTVDRFKTGYFFGVTYNFKSTKNNQN